MKKLIQVQPKNISKPPELILTPLRPIYLFCKIFGLAPFRFTNSTIASEKFLIPYFLYSILLPCVFYFFLFAFRPIQKPLELFEDIATAFCFTTCLIPSLIFSKNLVKMLRKLQELQNELRINFGNAQKYFAWFWLFFLLFATVAMTYINMDYVDGIFNAGVYSYGNFVMSLICFFFFSLLKLICDCLKQLRADFERAFAITLKKKRLEAVIRIRKLYSQIWLIARLININYNVPIAVIFGNSFLNVTISAFYWLKLDYSDFWFLLESLIWSLVINVLRLLFITFVCQAIGAQVQNLAKIIHARLLDIEDEEENALVLQFSLQLIHEEIEIWACGLFKIDNSVIYAMLGATTSYSVLIFQISGTH